MHQNRIIKPSIKNSCLPLYLLLNIIIYQTIQIDYHSNFNISKISNITSSNQPIVLPLAYSKTITTNQYMYPYQYFKYNIQNQYFRTRYGFLYQYNNVINNTNTNTKNSNNNNNNKQRCSSHRYPLSQQKQYKLKRYQLIDTNYKSQQQTLSQIQQSIIYNSQAPQQVFNIPISITIFDYQILQLRNIQIILINPTDRFKFCVTDIYTDYHSIERIEQKKLPFCINQYNKYPFLFNIYITQHNPLFYHSTIYFVIRIYDGQQLVDQKIWPRLIIININTNHLHVNPIQLKTNPLQIKNCLTKNHTSVVFNNPMLKNIKISFQSQIQLAQKIPHKNIFITSHKSVKLNILPKSPFLLISTVHEPATNARFPILLLPFYCIKYLQIHNINQQGGILILNNDRSILQITVPVTNYAKQIVQIKYIEIHSNNQNVELKHINDNYVYQYQKIQPGQRVSLCKLILHVANHNNNNINNNNNNDNNMNNNMNENNKNIIQIKIGYNLISNSNNVYQAYNIYQYYQFRNPVYVGSKRFIDITKQANNNNNNQQLLSHTLPIRNNLNIPILLNRVIFNQKIFKVDWITDRQYIYPNKQRQQFTFQYIGSRQLKLSPLKYFIILQFNNNIIIPIQIIIYDNTLQCIYNNIVSKCNQLTNIDYGYFRTNTTKFKQIIIRNWNPIQKQIKLKLFENVIHQFGINCTFNIFGPFPHYQLVTKYFNNNSMLSLYLKPNHYIILNIAMSPLKNATSGQLKLQLSTQHEQIAKKIKFKVQNGTIALIPQILRISSAYQYTVQYLNLVSTFSQPYKIKNTYVNNSHINIFFNNHSEIYQNQWIGLALVYQPFYNNYNYNNNNNPTSSSLLSTSVSTVSHLSYLSNVTDVCCGNQFMWNYFINILYHNQYQKYTYVSVRVITTTELETNSTIVIDNTPPKLIKQDKFSIAFINYNDYYYSIPHNNNNNNNNNNINDNKQQQNTKQQQQKVNKYNKDYKISIKNVFKQYLKYKPIIIPKSLYQDTKQYISSMKKARKIYQDTMLCVNNIIAIKHNFSPQMVKTILALDTIPQQITIQPLGNQQYYIGSQKKNVYDPNSTPQLSKYVRKTVANGARVCYKMNTTKYIKQLIQSYILNQIAQNFNNQIFHLFVQKQMEYYNSPQYQLIYDEFYDSLKLQYNYQHYCKKSVYPFFKFCKQINIIISTNNNNNNNNNDNNKQQVLAPYTQKQITIRPISKFKQIQQSFYIVILNNITKYQVHYVQINITQPKLKINKLYAPIDYKNQQNISNNTKNNMIEIPKVQNYLRTQISKKQLSKLIKIKQNEIMENQSYTKKYMTNCLLILLKDNQIVNQQFIGQRSFTIKNIGTIDIQLTHIGFDKYQKLCKYQGIQINQELCNGFVLAKGQQKNITLKINVPTNTIQQLKQFNMYMYNEDTFYFKYTILLKSTKNISQSTWQKSIYSLMMTALSFIFIVLVILMFKRQIDEKQNAKRINVKSKIMSPSNYGMLGIRIEKRVRKLQPIPQQQILAVKDIQQSKIKQFFNSSGESQISKRPHTQQQQLSKIQILNALKNDRNSMSASEESSIDFIDLNALNKSTQNIQQQQQDNQNEEYMNKETQSQQQSGDKGSLGSGKDGSDADSNFNDGDQIQYSNVNTNNYGWGDKSQEQKKEQQSSNSYYNVFFSQNPLKKDQKTGPFHWMNDLQQRKR